MVGSRGSGTALEDGEGEGGLGGGLPTTEAAADAGRIGRVCWLEPEMVGYACFFERRM
jgi:hypothetical protein